MLINKVLSILVVSLVLFASCSSPVTADRILFSSGRNGNSDIFLMDGNGANLVQLTQDSTEQWSPVWIDDNRIAFLSQSGNSTQVLELNLRDKTTISINHPAECLLDDKNYVFSPLGKRMYVCEGDVYITDLETENSINITADLEGSANYVCWLSEDEVSFTSNHLGNNEVFLYDLVSKKLSNLSQSDSNDERGAFSSDGRFLLFSSDRYEKGNPDIVLLDRNKNTFRRMTSSKGFELIARWSQDDQKFYFGSNKEGNWEIYRYDLKNDRMIRLTTEDSFDGDPRIN